MMCHMFSSYLFFWIAVTFIDKYLYSHFSCVLMILTSHVIYLLRGLSLSVKWILTADLWKTAARVQSCQVLVLAFNPEYYLLAGTYLYLLRLVNETRHVAQTAPAC